MKRWLQMSLLVGLIALFIAPAQINAYSYGDANEEDVAETFKLVNASLSEPTPNWKAAEEAYKVRRAELTSHFGDKVTATLDHDFEIKDAPLTISNFKAVLVMNLERRFSNAKVVIKDYPSAKVLLAKAKATFDTLAPYISADVSASNQAFEDALDSLGNPGLFGVGKKAVEPEVFAQKVDSIYNFAKPLFVYKAYIKPVATAKPTAKPTVKPTPVLTATPTIAPTSEVSASPTPTPTATPVASDTVASATPTPVVSAEPTPEATVAAETPGIESIAPSPDNADIGDATKEAHAPMEQSDKTNSSVTIFLIGGVIIIGGGFVWFAKKKKWF
ncbi:LPXTG cell wall anchor domain-containing protein [Paenibacillus psychroresistens]|uniref:LPXTG cell wall anchor domain-containing protein n=1 Tax=Paenibacillus psychroresistens TaxID=1778678 RepID=A0A6B8RHP0_9BACL|nr:LPXTG cell wall anchor domain-containing protein [Paenibacillus psychroresistens]QGQ95589.1 LPXTG cell wall anchor domain-containing protein [Paenibacillus psychroresistens]